MRACRTCGALTILATMPTASGAVLPMAVLVLHTLHHAAAAAAAAQPVQLCKCDAGHSAAQAWVWGTPSAGNCGGMETSLSQVRLRSDPSRCLFMGGGTKPTYLSVGACNSTALGAPLKLSFRAQHNAGLVRDRLGWIVFVRNCFLLRTDILATLRLLTI